MHLHPKIQAALFGALAVALVTVAKSVGDVYENAEWWPYVAAAVPVIAGYLKSAE